MFNSGLIFVRDRRIFCSASCLDRLGIFTQPPTAWVSGALRRWERCRSVKLNAHFRVEVQNDGRSTSSPPYVLMNYVNALGNARRIAKAHFYLSHCCFLHTQQQLRSKTFEHKLILNKGIGNIITIPSLMRRS